VLIFLYKKSKPKLFEVVLTEEARPAPHATNRHSAVDTVVELLLGQVAALLASNYNGRSSHHGFPHADSRCLLVLHSTHGDGAKDELCHSGPAWYWNRWDLRGMEMHASAPPWKWTRWLCASELEYLLVYSTELAVSSKTISFCMFCSKFTLHF